MALSKEEFLHLCRLAKLAPDAEKREYYGSQCGNILAYMDKLAELNCSDIEPLYSPVNLMRRPVAQSLRSGGQMKARRIRTRGMAQRARTRR